MNWLVQLASHRVVSCGCYRKHGKDSSRQQLSRFFVPLAA
jgi:hypothetical protein